MPQERKQRFAVDTECGPGKRMYLDVDVPRSAIWIQQQLCPSLENLFLVAFYIDLQNIDSFLSKHSIQTSTRRLHYTTVLNPRFTTPARLESDLAIEVRYGSRKQPHAVPNLVQRNMPLQRREVHR